MLPENEAEIAACIAAACARREPLLVQGAGTKLGMLRPVQAADTLSLRNCAGVTLYAPKELVFSARAGTAYADIENMLAEAGQFMIAEPPDYAALLGRSGQSLGGVVATNLSGPRRIAWGAIRDHVLGVRAVNGMGAVIRGGGRVLKNVTGLDLCKLLTGSHGTLAVLTEITVKVLPKPESSASVVLRGLEPHQGVAALSRALGSAYAVSGAAYLPPASSALLPDAGPGSLTLARIEDFAVSVAYRTERLRAELSAFGAAEIWPESQSMRAWAAIRDATILPAAETDAIWRISVRPSHGPGVLARLEEEGARGYLDWGGGLLMLAGPATETLQSALEQAVRSAGGVWSLLRGPESFRAVVKVVPPEATALAAITRRLKAAMDPAGILNPGRIFAGV
jgi:glycolate oxidase FAD binding subunit